MLQSYGIYVKLVWFLRAGNALFINQIHVHRMHAAVFVITDGWSGTLMCKIWKPETGSEGKNSLPLTGSTRTPRSSLSYCVLHQEGVIRKKIPFDDWNDIVRWRTVEQQGQPWINLPRAC